MNRSEKQGAGQRVVLIISVLVGGVGLMWIAESFVVDGELRVGNPVEARVLEAAGTAEARPRRVRAKVASVEGQIGVREGDACEFVVERFPTHKRGFECRAQVLCGGVLLYGGREGGYFPCALYEQPRRDVIGDDPRTSGDDGDAAMHLDTTRSKLRIWDDKSGALGAFELHARVQSVR